MFKLTLSSKQIIDHFIGSPVAWTLNAIAQIVGYFLKRDHTISKPPRTILFLKFVGIGSIVRASFLLKAARTKYPNAKIVFGVFPGCEGIVRMYPQVDDVFVINDKSLFAFARDTFKLIFFSWREKVDLVIDLEVHAKYSSIISTLTCATNRAGFSGTSSMFRRGLYTHLVFWNPIRFVDHAYTQLGLALGLIKPEEPNIPQVPQEAQTKLDDYFKKLDIDGDSVIVGINPNASDLKTERRWPLENFAEVINHLPPTNSSGKKIVAVILGAPYERKYTQELFEACIERAKVRVINTAGELPFASFVALLRRLDALITNDSGPLHIAGAFAVPTVSLWGPTHPINYSPRGANSTSLYRPIYCSPCTHAADIPPCGGDNQCLKRISWLRGYKALMRLLSIELPTSLPVEEDLQKSLDKGDYLFGYWRRSSSALPVIEQ